MAIIKNYNEIAGKGIEDHADAYQKLYNQKADNKPTSFYRAEVMLAINF